MANEFKVKKGLIINGSGSTILDIQGSQGQLFSVTDNLSGSLFSVNDISGLPILQVSSDDSVKLGTFNAEAIKVSGSTAIITGSLFGTSSFALTSSFVASSSYALSSSFATTASFALTSSNIQGGDTNYIPIWNTATSLSSSIIYQSGSNIGIGTTSPSYKLHIESGDVLVGQSVAKVSVGPQGTSGDVHFGSSGLAAPTTGSQDYGFYAAHNAYRTSTGAWVHSRTSTIPAVRILGSGGVSSGNSGFSFDYSVNTGTGSIAWTNLMKIQTNGNVGIGTTTPNRKLHVESSGVIADFKSTTTQGLVDIIGTSNQLRIGTFSGVVGLAHGTGTSPHITIASGGNVGIGTTNPDRKLTVHNAASSVMADFKYTAGGFSSIILSNTLGSAHIASVVNDLLLSPSGSERVRITATGNVGIGITNPSQRLVVSGSAIIGDSTLDNPQSWGRILQVSNAGSNGAGISVKDSNNEFNLATYGGLFYISDGIDERITITSAGNVGIGTTTPNAKLDVSGSVNISGSGVQVPLQVSSGSTSLLFVSSSGNVGIGTSSPASVLHVLGGSVTIPTLSSSHPFLISGPNNSGMSIISSTGNAGQVVFGDESDADVGRLRYDHSDNSMRFWTNADERMRISSTGNVGIGTTSPGAKLDIKGDGADFFLQSNDFKIARIQPRGTGADLDKGLLSLFNGSTEDVRIDTQGSSWFNGGNVGIGTASPAYKLDVNGDTNITGTLTATVKSFIIDHPTKEGKKLQYGVLEGPEHSVYVRGKLTNNNTITLPDYWTGLVHEDTITVNLTPIGRKQDLWVEKVTDTAITVGSNNKINCFYTVFAERKDVKKLITEFDKE